MHPKRQMLLDLIGWNFVLLAFICFAYVATVQKTVGMEIIVPIIFVVGGLSFGFGTSCLKNDWRISQRELQHALLFFIIVFGAIMTVQVGVVATLSKTPFGVKYDVMDLKVYGVLIGVSEEILFRGVLLIWFSMMTPLGPWLGIPMSAGAWTIFHLAVYGTSPVALILVFMVGIVLGFIATIGPESTSTTESNANRRLWVFMGAHALVNLIALGTINIFTLMLPVVLISILVIVWATQRRGHA
jgi:membrane protease YdiL (CAAX protease family)